jgi:hypothetical protein
MPTTRLPFVLAALLAPLWAQDGKWPYSMQFGPALTTTFAGGGRCGTVDKGLVVRLGDDAAVAFDTELLRVAALWTDGWLRLRGTAYDGSHGPMPSLRGFKIAETAANPGWAMAGEFADPRAIPHGPLPRTWGSYRGHRLEDGRVVISYRVGGMDVGEGYRREGPVIWRTLELAPSKDAHTMVVLDGPTNAQPGSLASNGELRLAMLQWVTPAEGLVEVEATPRPWPQLVLGAPSADDFLASRHGHGAAVSFVPGFARAHGADDAAALLLPKLHDGLAAESADDWQNSVWFDKRRVGERESDAGRFLVDLGQKVEVSRVTTFSWHAGYRSIQKYVLYGSAADAPDAAAADPAAAGWVRIAAVDTAAAGEGDKHAASIAAGGGLGSFRHLLLDVQSGGCFFSEIDVWAGEQRAPVDVVGRPLQNVAVGLRGAAGPELVVEGARILLRVPPHEHSQLLELGYTAGGQADITAAMPVLASAAAVEPLPKAPAPRRWGEPIVTSGQRGSDDGPFAVDTVAIPFENRFGSRMRTAAFDFFSDGRAAVSTWNGDVWVLSGLDDTLDKVQWRRFATGLFDPLGLRIVDDVVHVLGRDGITRLQDENGDGEADDYQCFNHDVFITPAFHEFAFDLQTDLDGNFYFSKGAPVNPGGRGFMKIVPHHGTILRVARDGSSIETIATGLRAPNGIAVSKTGVITSGDNEGTFMPRCRLNWIEKPGFYAGVRDTAHRSPVPELPDLPLCWMPMDVDNSSGGQVWVTGKAWRDLEDRLLHLSYGTCSVYLVLQERVGDVVQGGVVRLPASFSSSCMRGRFSPVDGQLWVVGLQGWQTSAAREGGFHRVRRTGAPLGMPIGLRTFDGGVYLTFAEALDEETAADPTSYGVEVWNYRYSPNYGSPEVSVLEPERQVEAGKPNRDPLAVEKAELSRDGRTVRLTIAGMQPVHQMKVTWNVDAKDGRLVRGDLHCSIHVLAKDPGFPGGR